MLPIKTHSPDILTSSYIGKGLSQRFIARAKEKNRPEKFSLWKPKYTGNKKIDKKAELNTIPSDLQDKPLTSTSLKKRSNEKIGGENSEELHQIKKIRRG